MSKMLTPADIAVLVELQLNAKAIELFDAEEIDDKIVFNVTADYQEYERMQKAEYELDDYQDFTPVIISRIDHYEYPADYLRYEEKYTLAIYGYADQLQDLEKVIKAYTVDENTINKSVMITSFRVTKETTDVSFGVEIEPQDGSLRKRVIGNGGFSWTFLDGIMTSYDIVVTIDGEVMPYISFDWGTNIDSIQSQAINTTGQTINSINTKPFTPVLTLPYISTSEVIKNLYKELYSRVYNKSHVLTYYDTALDETFTYNVKISTGTFSDIKPKVLDFIVVFERISPTVTLTIDGVEVPLIDFDISTTAQLDTDIKINSDKSASAFLGTGYAIIMSLDISDETNTKTQELLSNVLNQTFETPHIIQLIKGSITASYEVLLQGGSYKFNNNPIDSIQLVFTELDGDI